MATLHRALPRRRAQAPKHIHFRPRTRRELLRRRVADSVTAIVVTLVGILEIWIIVGLYQTIADRF
jgi:hypothetical protein